MRNKRGRGKKMFANLTQILEQVEKDKGIGKEVLIEALESALLKAAEKRFGASKEIEAHYDEESGEIELFAFKTVVEDGEVEEGELQLSLKEALESDPEAQLGDSLGFKLDASEFGRIDAQMAKQIIIQKIREAERDIVFNEYSDKQGEIIIGIVQRFERGDIIVDMGRAEALLPRKEQVRRESYRQGERIRGLVLDVRSDAKGPQVILSRTHPDFLIELFKMEVPEIYEGIVEIKGAAREPGERAKIAVVSNNVDVDPVGACVGVKGSRVQSVVQELKGEKIDIIHYSDDPAMLAKNALSPAQITKVIVDDAERTLEVIVPDDQLSLAIGKKGQNVRLAAKLTGWKIDINMESDTEEAEEEKLTPEEALKREVEAAGIKDVEPQEPEAETPETETTETEEQEVDSEETSEETSEEDATVDETLEDTPVDSGDESDVEAEPEAGLETSETAAPEEDETLEETS